MHIYIYIVNIDYTGSNEKVNITLFSLQCPTVYVAV